jgi:hypothetical protein
LGREGGDQRGEEPEIREARRAVRGGFLKKGF